MNKVINLKLKILFTFLFVVFGLLLIFSPVKSAKAEEGFILSPTLPKTELENFALSSPQDVYFEQGLFVINDGGHSLLVSNGVSAPTQKTTLRSLGLIKYFDENNLLVSSDGSIYMLSKTDWSASPVKNSSSDKNIGNNFDYNGSHLITSAGRNATIYNALNGTSATEETTFGIYPDSPVAINSNGNVFFVNADGKICITNPEDAKENADPIIISNRIPTKLLANDNFLYFISEGKIFSIDLLSENYAETELKTEEKHSRFQLGNVINPTGIAFKGDNLLITTAEETQIANSFSAVHEFKVNSGVLEFTGFAIANGKTAYNRASKNAKSISVYENTFAVLDEFKLTICSNNKFSNLILSDLGGFSPDKVVLGKNTALLYSETARTYKLINLSSMEEISSNSQSGNVLADVYYQNGTYYLLSLSLNNATVYLLNEHDYSVSSFTLNEGLYDGVHYPKISVDTSSNIYFLNTKDKKLEVYSESGLSVITENVEDGVIECSVDLNGKIYLLYQDKLTAYYGKESFSISFPSGNIAKNFALSFSNKNTYYLFEGKETVYSSSSALNASISDVDVPNTYKVTGESADINALRIFSLAPNAPLYSVSGASGTFNYLGLSTENTENLALITTVTINGGANIGSKEYSILLGNGVYIAESSKLTDVTETVKKEINSSTFYVTTNVSAYYLPVISKDDSYILSNFKRLKTGESFLSSFTVDFLGRTYYYANLGENIYGYVPSSFTAPVLSKDALLENYKVKKVKETDVYSDKEMQNKIITLNEDTEIKLVKTENGVSEIYYLIDDGFIKGYVSSSSLKETPNTALKTALVVFSTALVVFATSLYLILKKREA